jgi:hypothetical protein
MKANSRSIYLSCHGRGMMEPLVVLTIIIMLAASATIVYHHLHQKDAQKAAETVRP